MERTSKVYDLCECLGPLAPVESAEDSSTVTQQLFGTQQLPMHQDHVLTLKVRNVPFIGGIMLQQDRLHPCPREDVFGASCCADGWLKLTLSLISIKVPHTQSVWARGKRPPGHPPRQHINKWADVSMRHISPGAQLFGDWRPKTKTFVVAGQPGAFLLIFLDVFLTGA